MLDQELQAAGLTLSEAAKARFAHDLATQPPLLLGLLLGRFHHRKRRADGHQWPAGNPEVEALSDRLLKLRGVSQVTWSESDSDRLIFVRLDPWSDRIAKRVRRKAAPHKVRFID